MTRTRFPALLLIGLLATLSDSALRASAAVVVDTPTPTSTPGVIDLGVNTDSGLPEIRVQFPGVPDGARYLDMALIPPGTFTMGSPDLEIGHYPDEGPQHQVTISRPFYLATSEITRAQWFALMGTLPDVPPGIGIGDDHPVFYASWNECQPFIAALNALGIGTFRLPTEAEWEYACRAGTTSRFYWGDDPARTEIDLYAVYELSGSMNSFPAEVVQLLPNAWGLFDMGGNVEEFCEDWYGAYSADAQIDPKVLSRARNELPVVAAARATPIIAAQPIAHSWTRTTTPMTSPASAW